MKFIFSSKYKKLATNLIVLFAIFYLLVHSKVLINSISLSTNIFISKLIPALFPYLLITELLINSGKVKNLSYGISSVLSKIFHIPKCTTAAVVIGYLLGYPNAAKYILKLYSDHEIDEKTATKLISFTSNANMSFVLSTVGISMFKSIDIGIILLISHLLSSVIIGIFCLRSYNNIIIQQTTTNANTFTKTYSSFELLYISIYGTLKTLAYIFAYTVIFSLIPTLIFSNLKLAEILKTLAIGLFEISNGINSLAALDTPVTLKLTLTSFVLSFSSLMILVQIFSFAHKARVKFKDLLKYKLLQGLISSSITYITLKYIYVPALPAFVNNDSFLTNLNILPSTIYMFAICLTIILSLILFRKKRQG